MIDFKNLNRDNLVELLTTEDEKLLEQMFQEAYRVKLENVGNVVYFRGIIEFSNICTKDCFYCGIRKSNGKVERYMMGEDEILEMAKWTYEANYGSLVLQSGERSDEQFVTFIERILKKVKQNWNLGITLSLGEQTEETFQRWFDAGAHRYLLRIETSNPELYKTLHPADHMHDMRLESLASLRRIGYQVGTGVMIGLPGQTAEDLANDILFFKEKDIDMIGMGPYVVHHDTPLAEKMPDFNKERQLDLALRMIALTRIHLKDVNIASTTALQALDAKGREYGLRAGANIIMPVITDTKYRKQYLLYEDKPCVDENASMCRSCLEGRIQSVGESISYGEWGDSPHFKRRNNG